MKANKLRIVLVYLLLAGGSLVFLWPFLWLGATSAKVNREMFAETLHLWPERPIPAQHSPYVDTRIFRDVHGPGMAAALPLIEERLRAPEFASIWPEQSERESAIRETARGVYRRLLDRWPADRWKLPADGLRRELAREITPDIATEAFGRVWRVLRIGQVSVDSDDLREQVLVPAGAGAAIWRVGGDASARLVPGHDAEGDFTELNYDFSRGGSVIQLSAIFAIDFPLEKLRRVRMVLRPDDSWHATNLCLEKLGARECAERTSDLGDFKSGIVTWQEPRAGDQTTKIRTWIPMVAAQHGAGCEDWPKLIRVTWELHRVGALGAWWAKIRRNYQLVFDNIPFARYVATSLFLVLLNIVGALTSSSLAAYSFARLRWPGRSFCFTLLLMTMMIPGQLTMIPHFLIMRSLGWYNTLYPLWVGSFFASAFNVFLLRQFIKGVPRDLEDAARMDGCGFWRVYWHVVLPLIRPTLVAIAIFTFLGTWNDFMGPLIYVTDQRLYPLSFGLYALNLQANGNTGMVMAGSLLMTLPVIAIFFFAQRFFLQSVAFSGVK